MVTRVYIGRLSYRAKEHDIKDFFRGYGKITEIILKNGYGFVDFEEYRDADDAVHDLNNRSLAGDKVFIELAKGTPRGRDIDRDCNRHYRDKLSRTYGRRSRSRSRSPRSLNGSSKRVKSGSNPEYTVVVQNLSSRTEIEDLEDVMRKAGKIVFCEMSKDYSNEATVEFLRRSDADYAIRKLDGRSLDGKNIRVLSSRRNVSRSKSPISPRSSPEGKRKRSGSKSSSEGHGSARRHRRKSSNQSGDEDGRDGNDEKSDRQASSSPRNASFQDEPEDD